MCFVTDTEYCMQGGSVDYYETDQTLLHTIFNNSCGGSDSYLYCNNSIGDIFAYSNGCVGVYVGSGIYDCNVNNVGTSSCKM